MPNANRPRKHGAERSFWIFGSVIAMLTLIDLFAWATLWNVPNPMSALLAGPPPAQTSPLPRPVFAAAGPGGVAIK